MRCGWWSRRAPLAGESRRKQYGLLRRVFALAGGRGGEWAREPIDSAIVSFGSEASAGEPLRISRDAGNSGDAGRAKRRGPEPAGAGELGTAGAFEGRRPDTIAPLRFCPGSPGWSPERAERATRRRPPAGGRLPAMRWMAGSLAPPVTARRLQPAGEVLTFCTGPRVQPRSPAWGQNKDPARCTAPRGRGRIQARPG